MSDEDAIRCRDRCGTTAATAEAAMQAGWSYLQITGGWRCGPCCGALLRAAEIVGVSAEPLVDQIPPTSRGALPKETASGILPPSVKG